MKTLRLLIAFCFQATALWAAEEKAAAFVPAKPGAQPATPEPPTLGAKPPAGAIVLFDGKNLDAWAKKAGKDWLKEDGPAKWKLIAGDAMEVVPASDCLILHAKFGDIRLHAEFRTLGAPTNSGIYFQTRYAAPSDARRFINAPGYAVINTGVTYAWRQQATKTSHSVRVSAKNLLDRQHETSEGNLGDPRGVFFSYPLNH